MNEHRHAVTIEAVVVEENLHFTLDELCRACGAEPRQLKVLVEEGVLQAVSTAEDDWQFEGRHLGRARAAARLARDFELTPSSTALVLDLLQQIDQLRARMRQAGIG